MSWRRFVIAALLGVLMLSGRPAFAGKADDTLRIAVNDWWPTLDPYQFPLDEAAVFFRTVYETLISYDERAHKFVPRLAKSWKRIDDKTIEFDLRDDVKFHNGDKFDADDVVATINYIGDPKVKFRFKKLYDWVAKVEKLGPYKVRVTSKSAFATDLETMAYRFYIYDSKVLAKLDNKADYGRLGAIATGPYRMVSLNQQKMVLERFDGYYDKSPNALHRAPIKHIIVTPIPDRQTQIAQFMTGNIDIIRNVTADTAREVGKDPNARVTATHAGLMLYVQLDALGRSDNKVMKDQRVRKAFMEAIDRKELARTVIPGGESAEMLDGICVPADVGCASSTKPAEYNPEDAKKLLAEAGYPNGFDLEFDVHEPIKEIGEAIAGQLRKVGIRASVRPLPIALYVRMRGEGKFTAFLGFYPTGAQPDMDNIFDLFFNDTRDYWGDPVIQAAQKAGAIENDEAKRREIYKAGIDQVNKMNYILPVADLPLVMLHSKDVRILEDTLSPINTGVDDFAWAN
ncbi:MAG TPA: ABC transporter substrate-binding protein [Stellaceae bacterium]|jgi:peptide/nickel transport system substrate-binding protein|nr:ABC transporter substrate-binding protein [Stellaceae bacterium]